jgi:hypothetical protein
VIEPVRLVLDASAVRKFPSFEVGEPICEVRDEGARFGVPVFALASAASTAGQSGVALLVANAGFQSLDMDLTQWRQLAVALTLVDDAAAAHAIVAAIDADCEILTAQPELYASFGDDPPIIPIDS